MLRSFRVLPLFALFLPLLLSACVAPGVDETDVPSSNDGEVATTEPKGETSGGSTVEAAIDRFRVGDLTGAEEILSQVTEREPQNERAWAFLGQARRGVEDFEGALFAFEKSVEINPERYGAIYGAAALYARQGDSARALDLLERLRDSKAYDLSQISLDQDLASLQDEPRYLELLPTPEDFQNPFVEEARVIHEWVGEAAGDEFGWIARNLGDVDGDGVADLTTSAPSKDVDGALAGRVYTYSGKSGKLLWSQSGQPGQRLGQGIEAAGDVNGDGIPDVVAGAPGGDLAFVYSGADGEVLLTLKGSQDEEFFGRKVSDVGDVNGDGYDDVMVGAPRHDLHGDGNQAGAEGQAEGAEQGEDAGRVAIFSGKDGALLQEWFGAAGDRLGSSGAGAVVGDHTFLVVGAPDAGEAQRGQALVFRGLEPEPAFIIESDPDGNELGGMFVSVVGDVDADGIADVYASDWAYGAEGAGFGRVVVHSGADGSRLLTLSGEARGDGFGIGPADAGDVDGDGHADLVIGAWQHGSAAPSGGKVYLHSGKDGALLRTWTCQVMGDTFGFDATGMGDVDGDGEIDFLLTSAWSAIRGAKSGRMFVVSGK